ncbi:MAG TPA: PP2C family protein-serine/threonine phosphatase [Acidimicrobiales bacterium]|nr:PP2C family protein-serine/threonine phosphatase [Acidimicrobiales bacterium]
MRSRRRNRFRGTYRNKGTRCSHAGLGQRPPIRLQEPALDRHVATVEGSPLSVTAGWDENAPVHHWVLGVVALGYLAAGIEWLRTARSALERARGLEHQRRPAEQWRTLAAKDAVGSLLFFGLAGVTGVEAAQGPLTVADLLLVGGVGPTALSLGLARRFERLSAQVESLEDLAHRRAGHAAQRDVFADRFAERLAGVEVAGVPGVTVRSLYEPVEGALGGDFVGVTALDCRLDVVVGDVTGHGFDAALDAMRLKDLLLAELGAGESPVRALAVANAFICGETVGESFATAFVAQYQSGVVLYANAGHPPALVVAEHGECPLPPTGPLLGVTPNANFEQAEVLLGADERLVAYTDGLIEAYGSAGGLQATTIAAVVRSGGIDGLHAAIRTARHEPLRDDIAVVELRCVRTE